MHKLNYQTLVSTCPLFRFSCGKEHPAEPGIAIHNFVRWGYDKARLLVTV